MTVLVSLLCIVVQLWLADSSKKGLDESVRRQRRRLFNLFRGNRKAMQGLPIEINALDYIMQGENGVQSRGLGESEYYIGELYGGKKCNGVNYAKIVMKPQGCIEEYALSDQSDYSKAAEKPQYRSDLRKFTIYYNPATNTIQTKMVTTMGTLINGTSNSASETYYFCNMDDANAALVQLEQDQPGYEWSSVEKINDYFSDTNWGFKDYLEIEESDENGANVRIGGCSSVQAGTDSNGAATYASIKVTKLKELTNWIPTVNDTQLPLDMNNTQFGHTYTGFSNSGTEGEVPLVHYRMVKNMGMCVQSDFPLYDSGEFGYGGGGGEGGDSSGGYDQPDNAEQYDDDMATSNLQGQFKIDPINSALFPDKEARAQGRTTECLDDGSVRVNYYSDGECQYKVFSEKYGGPSYKNIYVEGSGTGTGDYFATPSVNEDGQVSYRNESIYLYDVHGCRKGPEQPYLKEGSVGTSEIAGSHKWAIATLYTKQQCEGKVYATDTLRGGLLYQCMPDPLSLTGPNDIYTRSFVTACGEGSKGYVRTFFNDLECSADQAIKFSEDLEGEPEWDNYIKNNGTCSDHMSFYAAEGRYGAFQAKSWQYSCVDEYPQGLGYSIADYSQPGCEGFQLGGRSFSLELGTNYSAPSTTDPPATVHPDTQPYKIEVVCDDELLVTKMTAKDEKLVDFYEMKSYRASSCDTALEKRRINANTAFNPARSTRQGCDKLKKVENEEAHSEAKSSDGISAGVVAGIVIASLIVSCLCGAGYYMYSKRGLPLPKPASQIEAEEAEAAANARREERGDTDAVGGPSGDGDIELSDNRLTFSHANPLHKSLSGGDSSKQASEARNSAGTNTNTDAAVSESDTGGSSEV